MTLRKLQIHLYDRLQFLKISELELSEEEALACHQLYEEQVLPGLGQSINYKLSLPKYQFLHYLIENHPLLVHGTQHTDIQIFQPHRQALFTGRIVNATFASSDAIWSMYFALINRAIYRGSLRNACFTIRSNKGIRRYYYFSINEEVAKASPWSVGMIYILPKQSFRQGGIRDEWISENPVSPLAKLHITPDDFPFIYEVRTHRESDPIIKTIFQALFKKNK